MLAAHDFAVMLNANARRVTPEVRRKVEKIVAPENVYYSHSQAESKDIVKEIAARRFPTVFTGGGDGTFIQFVNDYAKAAPRSGAQALPAKVGVLHLGTGNAVAQMVSSGNFECDLQSFVHTKTSDYQPLHLVQAEGASFPFAGMGIDAELLNDYVALKSGVGSTRWGRPLFQNLGGYFAAFFGRTMTRRMWQAVSAAPKAEIKITNLGDCAYILRGGEPVKAYGRGEVLYEGPMTTTIFGTCPYYGHGLTILPYSTQRAGYFQLRTIRMGMAKALSRLPSLWNGTYEGGDVYDWHVKQVKIETSIPVPYQFGGDGQGYRSELEVGLAPLQVNLLRFI